MAVVLDSGPAVSSSLEDRAHAAALRCMARWGVAKTTLDDVAREARLSRASIYRAAPGGRDAFLAMVAQREVEGLLDSIRTEIAAAGTLGDAVAAAMTEAGRRVATHPVLRFVLRYEPELVLPLVSFAGCERLLATVTDELAPLLERWLDPTAARRATEWAARIFLSYAATPGDIDLADPQSVHDLVDRFVLPAVTPAG